MVRFLALLKKSFEEAPIPLNIINKYMHFFSNNFRKIFIKFFIIKLIYFIFLFFSDIFYCLIFLQTENRLPTSMENVHGNKFFSTEPKLDYKDVVFFKYTIIKINKKNFQLIVPTNSELNSRAQVDLTSE
jgi:hypothetical protein